MPDLIELSKNRIPLAIRFSLDDPGLVMVEIFDHPEGIVFADVGWPFAPASHPFHIVRGQLIEVEPRAEEDLATWQIGGAEIRQIEHGDPLAHEWNRWHLWRESPAGTKATRELCRRQMVEGGFL